MVILTWTVTTRAILNKLTNYWANWPMGSTIQWFFCVSRTRLTMSESFGNYSIRLITLLFSMEGAEQVEDTVKELFYEKLFPVQSAFERGSDWDLANPTMEEEVVITEEVTTTTAKQEKTTYPTHPPQTVQLIDLPDDEELFYACAKYIGFLTLSCLFITKFICTKNSTLRRVRLL